MSACTVQLGDVCEFIRGVIYDKNEATTTRTVGKIPILRAGNIGEELDDQNDLVWVPENLVDPEQRLRRNDIAICMSSGSPDVVGKTARVPSDLHASVGSFCGIIRPKYSDQASFLSFFFRSPAFYKHRDAIARGANIQNLRFSQFKGIQLRMPADQNGIASLLEQADRLRHIRRYALELSDTFLPAAYIKLFGDPIRNPKHWPLIQLGDACERVTVGFVGPMVNEYCDSGIPLLRSLNVRRNVIDLSELKFVSETFHAKLSKSALRPGDVVSVRTGKPGVSAVIPQSIAESNCADLIVMTVGHKLVPLFLAELLNQRLGDTDHISGTTGAIQTHFNIERARELVIPLPPVGTQERFAELVRRHQLLHANQREALRQANHFFKTLLHRAFTGGC